MVEEEFISLIQNEIHLLLDQIDNSDFNVLCNFLDERISVPDSYVVMLGETSSGKSTIINGLLNSYELTVGAAPTTGAVTEVMDNSKISNFEYYAVNKDSTIENLSKENFDKLLKDPDERLSRLRLYTKRFIHNLQYLRLYDTPGYGAIEDYHEEIIKDFIPQSDIIIYVVSYKVGFQNNDNNFVSFINNLIGDDTKFYLVINRVPEGITKSDKRIFEITQHASDCLHRSLTPYLVKSIIKEDKSDVLPDAKDLWFDISIDLKSEERLCKISVTYLNLQKNLLLEIESYLNKLLLEINLSSEQKAEITNKVKIFLNKKSIINEKIENTFTHLNDYLKTLFDSGSKVIKKAINDEVKISNKWTDIDDCSSFVTLHLLPINTDNQINIIKNVIQTELTNLDNDIYNILNTAISDFEKSIKIPSVALENLLKGLTNKTLQKAAGYGLREFFAQFGGAGGTGAGVANAAKKGLKMFGDVIGKKFTSNTHNALAKFLSKIGATSAKSVTGAAIVIIESLVYLYDSKTWQAKLISNVEIGVDHWKIETLQKTQLENMKLKDINKDNVSTFFKDYEMSLRFENAGETQIEKDKINWMQSKIKILIEKIDSKLFK
jgi:ribosome biogenesis GTPase A